MTLWKCFKKVNFEKSQQTTKKHAKLPSMQRVKVCIIPDHSKNQACYKNVKDSWLWEINIHIPHITFQNSLPSFKNGVDLDQLASNEASWSRSTPFSSIILNEYLLTLKAPITTAADDKFCNIFSNFGQKKSILHENRLPEDDSHEISCLIC